jgi:NDP-sugar pyrophosphorylase family protein
MHVVIPMSGLGQRFVNAGYKVPKPLIEIEGIPIIEHVCNLFPGIDKFTFICNSMHLSQTNMRSILKKIKPNANIIEIPKHKKGPVYAVSKIYDLIDDDEEVIVNYCDFGTYWNFNDFLKHTRERYADGAVPSYKGFHPHMLGSTNYAFMREENQWMLEIKEKEPFTSDRMQEFASNGTYYFRKGAFVKKYFDMLILENIDLNGEYYVSLIYNLMLRDNLKISIYEIQHMLQWGTPQDVDEYLTWSNYFKNAILESQNITAQKNSITLIPLAGRGSRFSKKNYQLPKPLIEVSGSPMIIQAVNSLPKTEKYSFVMLKEHTKMYKIDNVLNNYFKNSRLNIIDTVTEGQAITCDIGLKNIDRNSSLLISASDNGMLFDANKYSQLINNINIDGIIFTFRHHVSSKSNPEMYGWVEVDSNNNVKSVSVKKPISEDPYNDHAIVGTFYFKKVKYFDEAFNKLKEQQIKVNGEFYVDSLMNEMVSLGYNVKVFEVDSYLCWGTPNDYETFIYWQSFFHKNNLHPYRLELDKSVFPNKLKMLDKKYNNFEQRHS